jgi:hypothetical protein
MSEKVETAAEFEPRVLDLATAEHELTTTRTLLRGVSVVSGPLAADVEIHNGSVHTFTIPAEAAAGAWFPFGDAVMGGGVTVVADAAETGVITALIKRMP